MRNSLIILALLFSQTCLSQQTAEKSYFKEVGWTVQIPVNFKLMDSSQNSAIMAKGKKVIEESNNIEADISETKTLFSAAKNSFSYLSATLTPFNPKKDGNYDSTNKIVKNMVYKSFIDNMPEAKIDSVSTKTSINGIAFDMYSVTIVLKEDFVMTMCMLSKLYKGYDFGITYLYTDSTTKEEIETALKNSKFNR